MEDQANLRDAFEHVARVGTITPHQLAAVSKLDAQLTSTMRQEFTEGWRAQGSPAAGLVQLRVPYLFQRDSATTQGLRMCFSSTCAMAAQFLKPEAIKRLPGGGQVDDRYLALVQRFGDTTEAASQIRALSSLGIRATFRTDGTLLHIIQKVQAGIPVPVGWLHHGPASAPTGGGHWSLAIGWDPQARQVIMNDPAGEADLVAGGWTATGPTSGRAVRYSERNWGPRWMVEGGGSGYWLDLAKA